MNASSRTSYQPLHASIRGTLDPEYVKLHDEILQYVQPTESQPWTPESRKAVSPLAFGAQKNVEVGQVLDRDIGDGIHVRILSPEGSPPPAGWPCLLWLHGGGWVNGGLNSENGFLRHVCKYLRCVVCTINYRHAPEHVYPTAINDAVRGLQWLIRPENMLALSVNPGQLIFGGLSAGGNLTAILSIKAAQLGLAVQAIFQVLICPVIDNSATTSTTWSKSQHAPWLTPTRMTWYREQYFGLSSDATREWTASPCFAPGELLQGCPKTFIAVAECDLLAPEGIDYGQRLAEAGVATEVQIYKGATHSVLVLTGAHEIGKQLVHDVCERLAGELGVCYSRETATIERQ